MKVKHAVVAGSLALWMLPVQAKDVKFLFSFALPPYVIKGEEGQAASGFEFEIIKAALAVRGHQVQPVFVAMGAIPGMLKQKAADAAQRGSPELNEGEGFFYADEPSVLYQDVAITLQKNSIALASIADLRGKSIVGFQGAAHFLGAEFNAVVRGSQAYSEISDEKRRVRQLYASGVQVYVGDINVFKYYRQSATGVDINLPLQIHKIFTPAAQKFNHAVFLNAQMREDFNFGLKQIKANGQYRQIVKKYLNE